MNASIGKLYLAALMLSVWTTKTPDVTAQPATKARHITAAQAKSFQWPTYRQVTRLTPVPEVKAIQFLLRNHGYFKPQPNGIFDDDTVSAVRAFQRAKGLKVDGTIGPQTWQPLLLRLKKGDRGDAVRTLQTILRETTGHSAELLMPDLPVDGVFGPATERSLRVAQDEANWFEKRAVVDGIAGPQIWSILLDGKDQP